MTSLDMRPRLTPVRPRPPSGPDRPHRATRLLAAVVAIALLLVGVLLGRATVGRSAAVPPTPTPPGAGDSNPASRDTAAGAVVAATAALTAISSRAYATDAGTRVATIRRLAVPDQTDALLAKAAAPTTGQGLFAAAFAPPAVSAWRFAPVGFRVTAFDPARATVAIWGVQVASSTGAVAVPATATWGTSTLQLVWSGDAWRLDFAHLRADAGPTPASGGAELSSDLDVIAADHHFTSYADRDGATP